MFALVPHGYGDGLELSQPAQASRPANARHRRLTHADCQRDLSHGAPLAPQLHHPIAGLLIDDPTMVRSRAPVRQRLPGQRASDPLTPPPVTDTDGLRRLAHRPSLFADS